MHPGVMVSVAFLVVLVGVFLSFCVGTWRLYKGRGQARPLIELGSMALIFGLVGWQSVTWLRTDHPEASQARHVGVWLELVSAFGLVALMLLNGWIGKAQSSK